MEWKHPLPLVSPKNTSSSMTQPGPGDTQPWSILEAMTSASGRGSYCGNMNVFSIWESSREGQKDLGAEPAPLFFLHPSGSKSLAKYAGNPSQSLWGCVAGESYVSLTHIHAHTQRGTPGSRNPPAQDHRGVLSLQPLNHAWLCVMALPGVSTCQVKILQHIPLLALLLSQHFISKASVSWKQRTNGFNLTFCFLQLYCELEQCTQCGTMVCALASRSCISVLENLLLQSSKKYLQQPSSLQTDCSVISRHPKS